jgi:hypothetical protein
VRGISLDFEETAQLFKYKEVIGAVIGNVGKLLVKRLKRFLDLHIAFDSLDNAVDRFMQDYSLLLRGV